MTITRGEISIKIFGLSELNFKLHLGYNETDSTYGWHGRTMGFDLFYSHFTDAHINVLNKVSIRAFCKTILLLRKNFVKI